MNRDSNKLEAMEAADWILAAQERSLTKRERKQLTAWLRRSPANVRSYLEAAAIWNDMAGIDPDGRIDVDALSSVDGVVPFPAASVPTNAKRHRSWLVATSAIAATLLLGLGAAMYWTTGAGVPKTVSTELGEQRSLALDDGSIVHLNTQSHVQIRYDERRRFVELLAGEALFTVAEDPDRLFVVRAGGVAVEVTGTQFNIRRRKDSIVVTVVAGAVRVGQVVAKPSGKGLSDGLLDGGGRLDAVEAVAGQQVNIDQAGKAGPPADVLAERVLMWMERRLVFDRAPLSAIFEEFNRYNIVKLRIGNPEAGNLQLSGVFSTNDPASLLDYLETIEAPAVQVRRSETTVTVHTVHD